MSKKKNRNYKNANSTASAVKRRTELGRDVYRMLQAALDTAPYEGPTARDGLDFDKLRAERRIKAAVNVFDDVQQFVRTACPDYPEVKEDMWMHRNFHLNLAYDYKEYLDRASLACAVWMLDQLQKHGRLQEARQLFPKEELSDEDVGMLDVWDSSHDGYSLRAIMWIIQHRNDDCVGLNITKRSELPRIYMDMYTTLGMHHQQVPSRERFETILSMIPQSEIDRAVQLFMEAFYEVLRRTQISEGILMDAFLQIMQKEENLSQEFANAIQSQTGRTDMKLNAEMFLERRAALALEDENHTNVHAFYIEYIGRYHTIDEKERRERLTPEVAAVWQDFFISDPYSICFAFLYLLDRDSDLPWVYNVSGYLMDFCGCSLPWSNWYERANADEIPMVFASETERSYQAPSPEKWYCRFYEDKASEDHYKRLSRNLAQLLYDITGCIMPRDLRRYADVRSKLEQFGVSEAEGLHPLACCMALLDEVKNRPIPCPPHDEEAESEPIEELSTDALQKQIRELEAEKKRLREDYHSAYREVRELKEELDVLRRTANLDRQELADLRELVFNQKQEDIDTDTEDISVELPYNAKKRMVVFGGHDSWTKKIKPSLPNVRFIDRNMLPNPQLIRKSDEIWIQTNALSHSNFYRIINEARKCRIPVRYFVWNSARKCAEQLAQADSA